MKPASIVTIKNIIPLYKNEELANNVELITFEEVGFSVVSKKGIYTIKENAIFILPDHCVTNNELFNDFIAPNGGASKSYLGNVNGVPRRIRAKKFSLHTGNGVHVYSNGILLQYNNVCNFVGSLNLESLDLTELLGITKYENPEFSENVSPKYNDSSLPFPNGVYKTDETNIQLMWGALEKKYPIILTGTMKVDGSSISIGITDEYPQGFITSRRLNKPLTVNRIKGRRKKTFLEYLMFWTKPDLNIRVEEPNDDAFVEAGREYLKLMHWVGLNNIILRGELNGKTHKGSGNKNNPSRQEDTNIKFFGADEYVNGTAVRLSIKKFEKICNMWGIPMVKKLFVKKFHSREEIELKCNTVFEEIKKKDDIMIEGIVLRNSNGKISCKFMNDEYDSKK